MYKTVKAEIKKLVNKTGISEDFLNDAAEMYSIDEDGKKATARYIINGLYTEVERYEEIAH